MHQFDKGDRVVYNGVPASLLKTGEKGIVEWVTLPNGNRICVLTDEGRVFWLEGSDLELEDSPAPS